jgi:hypothetical protein
MIMDLLVLADHKLNASKVLELGNKVKNKLSNFSLINIEHLRELELLKHTTYYKDIDENEKIEAKIYKMSIDKNNKIKFEKEFTDEQEHKQLEIAIKQYSKDKIINEEEFECDYWFIGDEVVGDCVHVSGCMNLSFDVDYHKIDFHCPLQYKEWIHLHKIIRDEWRKYFYQIVKLFGGNKVIYIPYYIFNLITEYIDTENDVINMYLIEEYLIEIFGENNKKIDNILENEYCGYIIDDFSDINLDKNMNINDFKKYLKYI